MAREDSSARGPRVCCARASIARILRPMPTHDEQALRASLEQHRGPVFYTDLKAHLARDAVFLVGDALELVDAALAVARNDVGSVRAWLESGALRRPDAQEQRAWAQREGACWVAVIVQPYVLVRLVEEANSEGRDGP